MPELDPDKPDSRSARRNRIETMRNEQASWHSMWQDAERYILPRRFRLAQNTGQVQRNQGQRRDHNIINNAATASARTLSSGMMAGITSPSRPWKKLTTQDAGKANFGPVKEWLHEVNERMDILFRRQNLYRALPTIYEDLGGFGTAALATAPHPTKLFRYHVLPCGSYLCSANDEGQIDRLSHEPGMTVRQVVERFGIKDSGGKATTQGDRFKNISSTVKSLWDKGRYEQWIEVTHLVEPNPEFDPSKTLIGTNKPFVSLWWEKQSEDATYLREDGYKRFPYMVPRWQVVGEDVYGSRHPGELAIGDTKALQHYEKGSAEGVDRQNKPPMVGGTALKNTTVSLLPGHMTYDDAANAGTKAGLRPAYEVRPDIGGVREKIMEHEQRIRTVFFTDLFLMLASLPDRERTASEIAAREQEKMLMLGPVLEQLDDELLDDLVDINFDAMAEAGMLPPPPEDLQGEDLKVEYISIMKQAQKAVEAATSERVATYAIGVAQAKPEILDRLDVDQSLKGYVDAVGANPNLLNDDDEVDAIRQQRAEQIQQAQAAEQMANQAQTMKDLASADTSGENALTQVAGGAA